MTPSAAPVPNATTIPAEEPIRSTGDGDRLRHIICVRCFPAFDGTREAPHDAVCICGKPVRAGEQRPTGNTMDCVMCNESRGHHDRERHSGNP